jgi:ATP-dependent phosphofructokinase / diphosphate-dependent phosphofructokinase
MSARNLLIVQGGGPTAVFNASLASIIRESLQHFRVGKIFGARGGMKGLASADIIDLSQLGPEDLWSLRNSPGAALGSSRFGPSEADLERSVEHLRRFDIRYLVFMGGNGTMRGADLFRKFCQDRNFDVQIIGVPKTIDNDISATDRCPGFASAARFVAQSTLDLSMDIQSLPQPVSIFETLGRDVGWLAASSTLARRDADDAPHLVYIPETPFSRETFLSDLDKVVSRIGWAVVVASEGIQYADGSRVFEQPNPSRNNPLNRPLIGGVAQYLSGVVGDSLGIRCRSEKPGLIGRSCMAQVSVQDLEDAELVGRAGVRALVSGESGKMVALCSFGERVEQPFKLVPLCEAGASHREIPADWLSSDALAVTGSFRDYLHPLVGELSYYPRPLSTRPRYEVL